MACEDQLNGQDLENAKLDTITIAEVATSRSGGESSGAQIDQTLTRFNDTIDTLEGRLKKLGAKFPPIDWTPSTQVTDQVQTYRYPASTGDIYIPIKSVPFTTGASFTDENWALYQTGLSDDQAAAIQANSVSDMLLLTPANGKKINTKGYYEPADGGSASYIVTNSYSGTPDEIGAAFTLANGLIAELVTDDEYIYLESFGAKEGTPAESSIQAALDYAALRSLSVSARTDQEFSHSALYVKNGISRFESGNSKLVPDGTTDPTGTETSAAVILQGLVTGGLEVVQGATISLNMDMRNGDRTAIIGDGCLFCDFYKCKIDGYTNDPTYNHRGIRLQQAASRNSIRGCAITGVANPTQRGLLTEVWTKSDTIIPFGGFFTGTSVRQPDPALWNIITDNILTDGSYAGNIQGAEHTVFSDNICHNQNHRGVWCGNGSWYNVMSGNKFTDFLSSGILMGYSSCHNLVSGNSFTSDNLFGGEATINITTGSIGNLIEGNLCDAPTNYSVYVATDSSYNTIRGNTSKNAYVAAFAVENDWIQARPTNSFFNRANYADPTPLDPPNSNSWTYNNLVGTVFDGNVVESGYPGRTIAAFSIAHIQNDLVGATPTSLGSVSFKNNRVNTSENISYGIYAYEQVSGGIIDYELLSNTWDFSLTSSVSDFAVGTPSGIDQDFRGHGLSYAENNGVQLQEILEANPVIFPDGDTTPSVTGANFFALQNSAPTNLTDFSGGYDGKEILVRCDVNTTIVYNSALIRTKGLVDIVGPGSNSFVSFRSLNGTWFEIFRSF